MMRKRLSRDESRAQTTKDLLDAAQKLIAKKGLSATSVEDIAAAAGYSRGAVYSNFASKYDLFIEILRRDHQQTHARFAALCDDCLAFGQILARLRALYSQHYRNNDSFLNWAEARMLAAREPGYRSKLGDADNEKIRDINWLVDYLYRRAAVAPPAPTPLVSIGLVSLFEGVKLGMLSTPAGLTAEEVETVVNLFIEAVIAHPHRQDASE